MIARLARRLTARPGRSLAAVLLLLGLLGGLTATVGRGCTDDYSVLLYAGTRVTGLPTLTPTLAVMPAPVPAGQAGR